MTPTPPAAPEDAAGEPAREKSFAVAFLWWFFLGFVAAHKFYLGRKREGVLLILAYFFLPLAVVAAAVVGMRAFGVSLGPSRVSPEDFAALSRDAKVIALAALALIVLAAVWIWDFAVLRRQVREHNERLRAGGGNRP